MRAAEQLVALVLAEGERPLAQVRYGEGGAGGGEPLLWEAGGRGLGGGDRGDGGDGFAGKADAARVVWAMGGGGAACGDLGGDGNGGSGGGGALFGRGAGGLAEIVDVQGAGVGAEEEVLRREGVEDGRWVGVPCSPACVYRSALRKHTMLP